MEPVSQTRPLAAEGMDPEQLLADTPPHQGKRPRARRVAVPGWRCALGGGH
jgi:hypothetical protein